jgi:tetratricopeptide (TPR) repeat protein/glycosyltransferase involved in cell wall biosynthesis
MCSALARRLTGIRPVVCVVPLADEVAQREADTSGVRLIPTGQPALDPGSIAIALRGRGIGRVAWWIGHDVVTGEVALKTCQLMQEGQVALIHHMSYLHYAGHKHAIGLEAMSRAAQQRRLFNDADRSFSVGRLLKESLHNELLVEGKVEPVMLIPGLPDGIPRRDAGSPFTAIVFGRMDPEDDRIKQGRLAVAGFARARRRAMESAGSPPLLRDQRPRIHFVGLEEPGGETEISLRRLSEDWAGGQSPDVIAEPFMEDRANLFRTLARAHLALMPSWHEGFGLTGWEAIAAEVPLVVSQDSGLYQTIKVLSPGMETGNLWPVSVGGRYAAKSEENFTDEDVEAIAAAVLSIAADFPKYKLRARELKSRLLEKNVSWSALAEELVRELALDGPHPSDAREDPPARLLPEASILSFRPSLAEDDRDFPESLLLRPENQIVPFHGIMADACATVLDWVLNEEKFPQRVALRLYSDKGGCGKTRLFIEVCRRIVEQKSSGWTCGFLAPGRDIEAELGSLLNIHPRLLVVIDYAETRRPDVRAVIRRALRAPANQRSRIILLGRGEGDWWDVMRDEERDTYARNFLLSLEGVQGPFSLPRTEIDDLETREQMFDAAQRAFGARLTIDPPSGHRPDLSATVFDQVLFLHLAALAALHGRTLEDAGALLDAALDRERAYWRRALQAEKLSEDLLDGLAQAIAWLTLIDGTRTARDAKEALRLVPRLAGLASTTRDRVFDLLRRLYPHEGGIDALRPDLLGERHVRACLRQDDELLSLIRDKHRSLDSTMSGLTVLARIAQHGDDLWLRRMLASEELTISLVERAISVASEVGDPFDQVLARQLEQAPKRIWRGIVNHIFNKLPANTVKLSDFAEVVLAKRVELLTPDRPSSLSQRVEYYAAKARLANRQRSNGRVELAFAQACEAEAGLRGLVEGGFQGADAALVGALLTFSNCCSTLGRYEEGEKAGREAEKRSRKLALADPGRFRPNWASSLGNLGNRLSELGRYEEALAAAEQAESIHRELAATRPDSFREDWASTIGNLSNRLSEFGRYEDALSAAQQTENIYRELAAARPDAFRANWATSLGNLSNRLSNLGRYEDALSVAEQAESINRELAAARPNSFRANWASSLGNLANQSSNLGRYENALSAAERAECIYQDLAAAQPDAFRSKWALSLNNLGNQLASLGRYNDALSVAKKAESINRELATARPDAFRAEWASSLGNLGNHLSNVGLYEDALSVGEQAESINRELAAARPNAFLGRWASSLSNLGIRLSELGQYENALAATERAESIHRELAAARPDADQDDWAASLGNLANRLSELGRYEVALSVAQQSESIYRILAGARPDALRARWASSLGNLGNRLSELGRYEDALAAAEQAESIHRNLADVRPDAFRADWASSLYILSNRLSELGRYEDALSVAQQAESIRRELAATRPETFREVWGSSLGNLSNRLSELGRDEDALSVAEQTESIMRELAAARPAANLANWATSLCNLGGRLTDLGRYDDALTAIERGESIDRELAEARPAAFHANSAISTAGRASVLVATGRFAEAASVAENALRLFEQAVALYRHRYLSDLACSRTVFAEAFLGLGRIDEAADIAAEAVQEFAEIAGIRPGETEPKWAVALAIRARHTGLDVNAAARLGRQALDLLSPHFERRTRALRQEMIIVAASLRATNPLGEPDPLPSNLATLLK